MLLLLILDVLVLKDLLNHASGKKGMSASSICLFYQHHSYCMFTLTTVTWELNKRDSRNLH